MSQNIVATLYRFTDIVFKTILHIVCIFSSRIICYLISKKQKVRTYLVFLHTEWILFHEKQNNCPLEKGRHCQSSKAIKTNVDKFAYCLFFSFKKTIVSRSCTYKIICTFQLLEKCLVYRFDLSICNSTKTVSSSKVINFARLAYFSH